MDLEVLELPLRILKVTGLDPRDTSLIAKVKCFMAFISLFVMVVTIVMEMQRKELSITTIVPLIEALMVGMEGFPRWCLFFIFKEKISEAIEESKTFWNINEADPDDESGADGVIRWLLKATRTYAISVYISTAATVILPILFVWKKSLPFTAWYPQNSPYGYESFYVIQAIVVTYAGNLMVGADTLFGAFCGILIAQFKLLNKKLENKQHVGTNRAFFLNLQESVRYHLKLIKYGEMLGNIYSGLLLVQYVVTVATTCIELYILSENTTDLFHIAKFLSVLLTLMLQMGIFCFLAEAVMDESESAAMAVYSSNWYSTDIKEAGLYVQMIVRRASKVIVFSAGGLVLIGRVSWLNVFKMSFSVYTLLTSLK